MSQFEDFNAENKLRIPLSAYAANIIDSDCANFSLKRTTLMNMIITNYYQTAECSISLRMMDYKKELLNCLNNSRVNNYEPFLNDLLNGRAHTLSQKHTKRIPADVNWQITLNKRVKSLLTEDPYTHEEIYYGSRPGHYVRALMEEYTRLPFYLREEIVFRKYIEIINDAIRNRNILNLTNLNGHHISMKPYKIERDPLSMYHYLIGYSITPLSYLPDKSTNNDNTQILSIRISRINFIEALTLQYEFFSDADEHNIALAIKDKGVQFLSSERSEIKLWLSDHGIKKYNTQLHLRPFGTIDVSDKHLYYFECTDAQILFYFFSFGKDVKILSPTSLAEQFEANYRDALFNYSESISKRSDQ